MGRGWKWGRSSKKDWDGGSDWDGGFKWGGFKHSWKKKKKAWDNDDAPSWKKKKSWDNDDGPGWKKAKHRDDDDHGRKWWKKKDKKDDDCVEKTIDFENVQPGDVVNEIDVGAGVTAIVSGVEAYSFDGDDNDAVVFDATNENDLNDPDLFAEEQGNVLIIDENPDLDVDGATGPDDSVLGGTLTFDFVKDDEDTVVNVQSMFVIDMNEGTTIKAFDEDGAQVGETVTIVSQEDGDFDTIELGFEDVASLEVNLTGSGAVDDIKLEICEDTDKGGHCCHWGWHHC